MGMEIPGLNRMPVVRTLPGSSPPTHVYIWHICGYILWTYVSFLIPISSYKQNVVSVVMLMSTEHTRNLRVTDGKDGRAHPGAQSLPTP